MVNIVKLKLSGSDKLYTYLWDYGLTPLEFVTPGIRAVVPTKFKDDGTLSLSIGTVEEVYTNQDGGSEHLDQTVQYKYVVQFLSPVAMRIAEQRMKELDGK
jgi:hypothetical protein